MPKKPRALGLSLTEVLVSVLIIGLVAITSYTAFSVLSNGNVMSRHRLWAINLSRAALEEVRAAARSNFDNLNVQYTGAPQATAIAQFTRTITIVPTGTANLQRAEVVISWNEAGQARTYQSVALLSRPPVPLPGNIYGNVLDAAGQKIVGARVYATRVGIPPQVVTTSTANNINCPTHPLHNNFSYHFCAANGNFQLPTGNWNLQVRCEAPSCTAYFDYPTAPAVIALFPPPLNSNEDRQAGDITLQLRPANASIAGRFVASDTGNPILGLSVNLRQNGAPQQSGTNNAGGFNFPNITFTDANPRCFTVYTMSAYLKGGYCGNFCGPSGVVPDTHSSHPNYNYHGWSSSPVRDVGPPVCANPWLGNALADRICVVAGQNLNLGNIALVPVPRATLQGTVRDSVLNPINNATVHVWWHNGTSSTYHWGNVSSDANGFYQISVPAEQSLFPNTLGYRLYARADGSASRKCCCNVDCSATVSSLFYRPALFEGDVHNHDFSLDLVVPDQQCGNLKGEVWDDAFGFHIGSALVTVSQGSLAYDQYTDASGQYLYCCPDPAYSRLPQGSYNITVSRAGYYTFQNTGNTEYKPQAGPSVSAGTTNTYMQVKLWPRGTGTIRGKLVQQGTTDPVIGAAVNLYCYSDADTGNDQNAITDANGNFVFNNVIESWPPTAMTGGGSYYKKTPARKHSLKFSHPDHYEITRVDQTLDRGQDLDLGNIQMTLKPKI